MFSKNPQISNFMKIRPVGAELLHTNGRTEVQTDMARLIDHFCHFLIEPKKHYRSVQGNGGV
jgi:hypothetical protein